MHKFVYSMKLLTTNFLTCAVKTCKTSPTSFPLHFKDAQLERTPMDFNPLFLSNILPRINWDALSTTASELGLSALLPETNPVDEDDEENKDKDNDTTMVETEQQDQSVPQKKEIDEEILRKLHTLLMETGVTEGKLVCGNCGFEYPVKEGVGNFLLPPHLV